VACTGGWQRRMRGWRDGLSCGVGSERGHSHSLLCKSAVLQWIEKAAQEPEGEKTCVQESGE